MSTLLQREKAFFASLKGEKHAPIYLLQGKESYVLDRLIKGAKSALLSTQEQQLNISHFREKPLTQALLAARKLPLIGKKKLLLVEAEASFFLPAQLTHYQAYIKSPNPATYFFLLYKGKEVDAKNPIRKLIEERGGLFTATPLRGRGISQWIMQYGKERGVEISKEGAKMVIFLVGEGLQRLASEIDKIALTVQGKVSEDSLMHHIKGSAACSSFALQEALMEGKQEKVLFIAKEMIARPSQHPLLPLISLLSLFYGRLLALHHGGREVASELKIPPYFINAYIRAARRHTEEALQSAIAHLHHADMTVKQIENSAATPSDILHTLIVQLVALSSA